MSLVQNPFTLVQNLRQRNKKQVQSPVQNPCTKPKTPLNTPQMTTKQLARRYAQITLAVMEHNGLTGAKISSAARGARHLSLGAMLATPKELDKALKLAEQIALSTRTNSVLTFREAGQIVYQFGLSERYWETYSRADLPPDVIGLAESRQPVKFEFLPSQPHTAFAGTTGSGKTESIKTVIHTLATSCNPAELKLVILDRFNNFPGFDNLAHLAIPRAVSEDDINNAILWAESQLKQRINSSDKAGPRLVFVADELETIFNSEAKVNRLKAMAKTGRQFRVNLVCGSQDFKESDLPGVVKELNNRFVGLVRDAGVSARLTGQAGLEAHKLIGGGDFLHVLGSKTTRFQVAQVTTADYDTLPRADIAQPEIIEPASEIISNFADSLPQAKGGRPQVEITPELLAFYVYHFPHRISHKQAGEAGISRRQHEAIRQFALDLVTEYTRLLGQGIRGYLS